ASPTQPLNRSRVSAAAAAAIAMLGATAFPGTKEVLDYTFYDTQTFTTVTAATKSYFAAPGTAILTSNFIGSGAMPSAQAFLVNTLRIVPLPGSPIADVINMMKFLSLVFNVENARKYAEGPAFLFPAGVGAQVEAQGTGAGNTSSGNPGMPSLGNVYRFSQPVILRPLQPFAINVTANASFTATTSPMSVTVAMDGLLVRSVG
ncbi:MAG: hypothetical protein RL030_1810, partial [Pseudomonadota bacterium]